MGDPKGANRAVADPNLITAESAPLIQSISDMAKDFLLVGLTGRTGSGIGSLARYLCGDGLLTAPVAPDADDAYDESERRDLAIAENYLRKNWRPFVMISATSVMISFLLDIDPGLWAAAKFELDEGRVVDVFDRLGEAYAPGDEAFAGAVVSKLLAVNHTIARHCADSAFCPEDDLVRDAADRFLADAPDLSTLASAWAAASERLGKGDYEGFEGIVIMMGIFPALADALAVKIGDPEAFSLLFQRVGNNIRACGSAVADAADDINGNLFSFSERIDRFCRALRHYGWSADGALGNGHGEGRSPRSGPVFIVIDSFKNIFETYYLKRKYPSFYLVAVSGDEGRDGGRGGLRQQGRDRNLVDLGEDLSSSKNLFKKYLRGIGGTSERAGANGSLAATSPPGMSGLQREFCSIVENYDKLRARCYRGDIAPFVLQDVMTCVENADVFLTRDLSVDAVERDRRLVRSLARFVTLALHPGLLKPTKVERCMQIAMTAKLNSGCLSRQVGAVVADGGYQVLSLGWNDVPRGSESCARRNLFDIGCCRDRSAYSEFELSDPSFREYIEEVFQQLVAGDAEAVLGGLPAAYCFKDIYQHIIGERDQIHTRSLHAEERALAACGNERTEGALLFTTSSPCELCAKKAREARISRIYYIEQYPGISHDHVIGDGPEGLRPMYEFFTGIVGAAYTNLYTPVLPYKDELEAIGVSPQLLAGRSGGSAEGGRGHAVEG